MPVKKQRKIINGVKCIQCPRCEEWTPAEAASNRSYLCIVCFRKYRRTHKANPDKTKQSKRDRKHDRKIQLELQGLLPIAGGSLAGVTQQAIDCMRRCDVEGFLKLEKL